VTDTRYSIVPPGIVAVPRTSPVRVRKRTPWHKQPDGQAPPPRPGGREWFGDRLFVAGQDGNTRAGYSVSLGAHVCCGALLVVFLTASPDPPKVVRAGPALVMPAGLSPMPGMPAAAASTSKLVQRSPSAAVVVATTSVAPPPLPGDATPVPLEAPSGITPEIGAENRAAGIEGGVAEGIAGGVVGGTGTAPSASAASGSGVMRVGAGGIRPPRKIKHVKPRYPDSALPARAQGAVIIEAIIGPDGMVQEAKVLHSVPSLDQAALDAVRQWVYEPPLLDGVPIAVIMTIVVNFTLQ
jgi:protein TonB